MPTGARDPAASFTVTSNLRDVLADLKKFEPKLATATRRRLRRSGDDAIAEMRGILAQPPPGGSQGALRAAYEGGGSAAVSRGSRRETAAGLKTRVLTGKRVQTVRIVGRGDPFSRSYNMASFRHPVYGNTDVWVDQSGRPYFGVVIGKRRDAIQKEIEAAVQEAIDVLAGKGGGLGGE